MCEKMYAHSDLLYSTYNVIYTLVKCSGDFNYILLKIPLISIILVSVILRARAGAAKFF